MLFYEPDTRDRSVLRHDPSLIRQLCGRSRATAGPGDYAVVESVFQMFRPTS